MKKSFVIVAQPGWLRWLEWWLPAGVAARWGGGQWGGGSAWWVAGQLGGVARVRRPTAIRAASSWGGWMRQHWMWRKGRSGGLGRVGGGFPRAGKGGWTALIADRVMSSLAIAARWSACGSPASMRPARP